MSANNREQKLIDIAFQLAAVSASHWHGKPLEEHMTWVAGQLRACGFDTQPMGASWGVLKTSPPSRAEECILPAEDQLNDLMQRVHETAFELNRSNEPAAPKWLAIYRHLEAASAALKEAREPALEETGLGALASCQRCLHPRRAHRATEAGVACMEPGCDCKRFLRFNPYGAKP